MVSPTSFDQKIVESNQQLIDSNPQQGILSSSPEVSKDSQVQNIASQTLTYGEYLSLAKYAQYIPGAPSFLKNKTISLIGDGCKVVKSGLKIKGIVDQLIAFDSTPHEKMQGVIGAAQMALSLSDTQFVKYLPEGAEQRLKWMKDALEVANLGCQLKEGADKVAEFNAPCLEKTSQQLEMGRMALWATGTALQLAGATNPTFLASLTIGYGALTVAKASISAASALSKLVS